MGRRKNASSSPVECVMEDEAITMATVKNLLAVQESMLRSLFESTIMSINSRLDSVVSTVADLKASVEFTQKDLDELKPVTSKIKNAEDEIAQVNEALEYLENQSRRNNIRVSGVPESPGETWADSEATVKEYIQRSLGIDVDVERAHRVKKRETRNKKGHGDSQDKPRTIICRLRDWKQREAVLREARKIKPPGLYISEDLARVTLRKREGQIAKMKEAKSAGKTAYFILDRLIIKDSKHVSVNGNVRTDK